MKGFNNWIEYFLTKTSLHAASFLLIAGFLYLVFWVKKSHPWKKNKIQPFFSSKKTIKSEIVWSLLNVFITGIMNVGVYFIYKFDLSAVYLDLGQYGITYFIFSIPLLLVLHDTFFYWTHRLMHKDPFFNLLHKIHHKSINPTPFTSHSQHPLEVILQNLFTPLIIMFIPLHYYAIVVFMVIATTFNYLGHLGYEVYPKWFAKSMLGKIFLSSTYHNIHHKSGKDNYGLYFMFWDKIMKTSNPTYKNKFDEVKSRDD